MNQGNNDGPDEEKRQPRTVNSRKEQRGRGNVGDLCDQRPDYALLRNLKLYFLRRERNESDHPEGAQRILQYAEYAQRKQQDIQAAVSERDTAAANRDQ